MTMSISRPLALAGLAMALALGPLSEATAGTKKRGSKDIMPAFSTGVIVSLAKKDQLDPELLAKARTVAARYGVTLRQLRRMAQGGDVLELSKALPDTVARKLALEIARLDDRIDYVEPDVVMVPLGLSNDKHVGAQWNYTESAGGINLPEAWVMSKGQGVVVAVVDTGVRPHVDLMANLLPGHDFISSAALARDGNGRDTFAWDEGNWHTPGQCGAGSVTGDESNWHGTHVAGTIAADANNQLGVAGVAPRASILPVRVAGRCGGRTSDIIDGLLWAAGVPVAGAPRNAHPAQVINLSLGTVAACSRTFQAALDVVRERGVVVVAAAGNSDTDVSRVSPAGCRGVIAVAASDRDGKLAYYSNHGKGITVTAPGGDMRASAEDGVLSLYNAGTRRPALDNLAYMQGTSMAAPHVSGVVALMLARHPELSPDKVKTLLKSTARPMSLMKCRAGCGGGLLDAASAVAAATVVAP